MRLYHDFETRSNCPLDVRGLDNYLRDPSTEVLMLAYAFDDDPVELWEPHTVRFPDRLREAFLDPVVEKWSWNAAFERGVLRHRHNLHIPVREYRDGMVYARYLSLPGSLDSVCNILDLPEADKKTEGNHLKGLFCWPARDGEEDTLWGDLPPAYRDWNTNPAEWEQFGEYCRQDVRSLRAAVKKMEKFPPPESERRLWEIDQLINERGVPCDLELAEGAGKVAARAKEDLTTRLLKLTGLENPNSTEQILGFMRAQGYIFSSMEKGFVARALAGESELTDLGKKVLNLRVQLAKTSSSKIVNIANRVSPDARLRYQFSFYGAARTGRWSGGSTDDGTGGVQLHNFARPTKEVHKQMDNAIQWLKQGDYDRIAKEFSSPLDAVGSCLRSIFKAPPGKKFVVADLSGIEPRTAGWLCGCNSILDVFRKGMDPYVDLASEIYHLPYDQIVDEHGNTRPEHAEKRQAGKVGILGCFYQISGGKEVIEDGNTIKTGLWGFAASLGVDLTESQAGKIVKVFRKKYHEVPRTWYRYNDAAIDAIRSNRPQTAGHLKFEPFGDKLLRVVLPSGRALYYVRPQATKNVYTNWKGEEQERYEVTYEGIDTRTKQWTRMRGGPGKWLENTTQALARDILAAGMVAAEKAGFETVFHCHDELVALVDETSPLGLPELIECMTRSLPWAPGLPLEAKGYEADTYRKD